MILKKLFASIFCSLFFVSISTAQEHSKILATVKVRPLPQLAASISHIAKQVLPPQQSGPLLNMLLSPWGYPDFEGLSTESGITLFVIQNGNAKEPTFAGLMQATETSAFAQHLQKQASLTTLRNEDWLFFGNEAEFLERAAATPSLITLAKTPGTYDITLSVNDLESLLDTTIEQQTESVKALGNHEQELFKIYLTVLRHFAQDTQGASLGLNLSKDSIDLMSQLQTKAGTQLNKAFQAENAIVPQVANYMASKGSIRYTTGMKTEPVRQWMALLFKKLSQEKSESSRAVLELVKLSYNWLKVADGTQAGTLEFNDQNYKIRSIAGGKFTRESLLTLLNNKSQDRFMAWLSQDNTLFEAPQTQIIADKKTYRGIKIHEVKTSTPSQEAEESDFVSFQAEQKLYQAAVGGSIMTASNLRDLGDLIDQIASKKPANNNLNQAFPHEAGVIMQYVFDLEEAIQSMTGQSDRAAFTSNDKANGKSARVVTPKGDAFQGTNLYGKITLNEGTIEQTLTVPTSLLQNAMQLFMLIQQRALQTAQQGQ